MVMFVLPVEQVKIGDILIADGGFTCLQDRQECKVQETDGELYVACTAGFHFLDGQLNDDLTEYVGFLKKGDVVD